MENIFLELVNVSISASWFIIAILLLRPLLKKAPKWVNPILWCLVGVRLFFPISIESSMSFVPSAETISSTILYERIPTIESGIPVVNHAVNTMIGKTENSILGFHQFVSVFSVIWLIGMVLLICYSAVSYFCLKRKIETAVKLQDNIYQSEFITMPFVLGMFRPCIYVPFSIEKGALHYVIAHEQAHIVRHDHWIKPLAFWILSIYWFNPFLWIAYIFLCKDIELACDERAISHLEPMQRAEYSKVLYSYGEDKSMRKRITICPLAFGEVGVKERVGNVLRYKRPTVWMFFIAGLSCVVIGICFLTNPKKEKNPKAPFEIVYEVNAPVYALNGTMPVSIDEFQLYISNNRLYIKNECCLEARENIWVEVGELTNLNMEECLFNQYFSNASSDWNGLHSAMKLHKNNEKVWRAVYRQIQYDENLDEIVSNYYMYYVLLQKDGSIYFACGEFDCGYRIGTPKDESYFFVTLELKESTMQKEEQLKMERMCSIAHLVAREERLLIDRVITSIVNGYKTVAIENIQKFEVQRERYDRWQLM